MAFREPSFTIGIEEEYLLVDRTSRGVAADPPDALFDECEALGRGVIAHEFMRSQLEVNTDVAATIRDARDNLADLRRGVCEIAENYGLAPIAVSTHPFSDWHEQRHTNKERYNVIAEDLQAVVRRLMICGMHVHVGIDDDELRIDLMNQASYFLPHLLALTTSSPFWLGDDTGLKSYRISIWDEMPRTGIPNAFDSHAEFQRHVAVLVNAGLIEDGTKLWWDLRPSARFPTLEMRICDVCSRLEDAVAVAALFACILRMLWRLKLMNQRWRTYSSMLINENRWRAQRYGVDQGLVDFGRGETIAFEDLLDELIGFVMEDAEALGCTEEIRHLKTIQKHGTSAHRQLATYREARDNGADHDGAMARVVDMLIEETRDIA